MQTTSFNVRIDDISIMHYMGDVTRKQVDIITFELFISTWKLCKGQEVTLLVIGIAQNLFGMLLGLLRHVRI